MGHAHILLADAGRPPGDDEYEWEYICETTVGRLGADELASVIPRSIVRPLADGHAYSLNELHDLRSILRLRGELQSDLDWLKRESDKFAFLVGWWVRKERKVSAKERIRELQKKVIRPAQGLLKALGDRDLAKEFSQSWGGLSDFDPVKIRNDLAALVAAGAEHIERIKRYMGRGRMWDHDLKRLHVYLAACFCEYFNHQFAPSRANSSEREEARPFQEAVELLAKPLFERRAKRGGFTGAIRQHVAEWNTGKRRVRTQFLDAAVAK